MCPGGNVIISQSGHVFATLDLTIVIRSKLDFDVVGHFVRIDIFQLIITENPRFPVEK